VRAGTFGPNGEPLTERGRCLDTERLALAGVDESAPAPRILEVLPVEMARDIAGALRRVEAGTNITIDLALGADHRRTAARSSPTHSPSPSPNG
jgi:hypothetical protein